MIRHIVFFSARDRADLDRIEAGLGTLAGIPHARHFELGRNLQADTINDAEQAAVDVVVYAEFEDEAALAAYKAHPLYEEAIRLVRPLRRTRVAADFASG